MTLDEVMATLEAAGSAQTRKTYARHGIGPEMFGVSYAELYKLRKRIKVDHDLALALWATGNHDARVFATLIDDAKKVDRAQAERWVADLTNYGLTDAVSGLIARSPVAREVMPEWMARDGEWESSAGWNILGQLALDERTLDDGFFATYLPVIEQQIHQAKNRTRYSMNNALIAIGTRSDALEGAALAVANRIGKVVVDHGETNCKTPYAPTYIVKARDRRRTKEQKAA
jgi:3-methyladenine DNA glycosylase AlkD